MWPLLYIAAFLNRSSLCPLQKYKNAIMPNLDKAAEVTTIEEKFLTPPKQNPDANDKLETIDESEAQKKALMDTSVVWK